MNFKDLNLYGKKQIRYIWNVEEYDQQTAHWFGKVVPDILIWLDLLES